MLLIEHFDKGVEIDPSRVCMTDSRQSKTYAEVQRNSYRFANAVRQLGFEPGTKMAVLGENCTGALECIVGIIRAGCIWTPVSTNQSGDAIAAALDHVDAELLLYTQKQRQVAYGVVSKCAKIRRAICIDGSDAYSLSLPKLLETSDDVDPQVGRANEDIVTLFSSGGTTGTPKGVMMTNLCWDTVVAGYLLRYHHERPMHLLATPITHAAGGAALGMFALCTTNVLLDGFEPQRIMRAIQENKITHMFLPPAAIRLLVMHRDVRHYDYSSLRFFIYGSAATPVETIKDAIEVFGPVMTTGFSQTETGPEVTFLSPGELMEALVGGNEQRLRSCGRATPFVRLAVMDDEGQLLPPNEVGELVVRSNQVMKGYYNDPDETALVSRFGWHHTADLGYRDADGFYYLLDRKRDVIISGGFNVFPSEIERVIRRHPAVRDCAVVGIPDEDWGEVPVAVVELHESTNIDVTALRELCSEALTPLQLPRSYQIWPELPRGQAGKVSRRRVQERVVAVSAFRPSSEPSRSITTSDKNAPSLRRS